MEYEIKDEPQGFEEADQSTRDGGLLEDPVALKRRQSVWQRKEIRSRLTGGHSSDSI